MSLQVGSRVRLNEAGISRLVPDGRARAIRSLRGQRGTVVRPATGRGLTGDCVFVRWDNRMLKPVAPCHPNSLALITQEGET